MIEIGLNLAITIMVVAITITIATFYFCVKALEKVREE